MKSKITSLAVAVAISLNLVSCASGPGAQTGAVLGGLGGAAIGGIIGNQSGRGLEGAAIGGALGAVGGNTLGNAQDQRRYGQPQRYNNGYNNGYNQPPQQAYDQYGRPLYR